MQIYECHFEILVQSILIIDYVSLCRATLQNDSTFKKKSDYEVTYEHDLTFKKKIG